MIDLEKYQQYIIDSGLEEEVTISEDNDGNITVSEIETEEEVTIFGDSDDEKDIENSLVMALKEFGVKIPENEKWLVVLSDSEKHAIRKVFNSYEEAIVFYDKNRDKKYIKQFIKKMSKKNTNLSELTRRLDAICL